LFFGRLFLWSFDAMTIQDLLDLANTGDPQAAEYADRYPELRRLIAAGMPTGAGFHKWTVPGAIYGATFAAYRFEFYGPTVDPEQDGPSIRMTGPSGEAFVTQTWLTRAFVTDCGAWGEITWTPTDGEAVTIYGVEKAHGAGELGRIYKAVNVARHITRRGRPVGSGAMADRATFIARLGEAWAGILKYGFIHPEDLTRPDMAIELGVSVSQFDHLLRDHRLTWRDVKRGNF
jgi:hypothetical protein